jgi:hypothetical protein
LLHKDNNPTKFFFGVLGLFYDHYLNRINYIRKKSIAMDNLTVSLVNQIFELEQKLNAKGVDIVNRNLDRIKHELSEAGVHYLDPTGESYTETRTDCTANIVGELGNTMKITRTIKPIIIRESAEGVELIQKGTVIVEAD